MLHLASETPEAWGRWAVAHLDTIVLDHAHCERKAASNAINLIFRYTDQVHLMAPMSALAREELEHFEQVLAHMQRRDIVFARQFPSPYAGELMKACRVKEPERLLDTLLCGALIEARSCERMQLLHQALVDDGCDDALAALYDSLLACEARHHATYVELARGCSIVDETALRARLQVLAEHEAAVVARLPTEPRLHNGVP
ncbi:MAG: tRNA-(ms[2]io[6]A)-hydroxylase [Nannocystaceae bacterium]|nr:tRNA-(ms[2]io[6]A)-hydroxylase [Nannocystaceae bacterium]